MTTVLQSMGLIQKGHTLTWTMVLVCVCVYRRVEPVVRQPVPDLP